MKEKKSFKIKFLDGESGSEQGIYPSYFVRLLRRKYNLELSSKPDLWFSSHGLFKKGRVKCNCIGIAYSTENIKLLNPRTFDYSFSYEDTDDRNFYLPVFATHFGFQELRTQLYGDKVTGYRDYPKSRFCNFLYTDDCPGLGRIDFTRKLMSYKKVDCPGEVLNNMPPIESSYDRTRYWLSTNAQENKLEFIKQHRFTIAFENTSSPNYVTEKIFQPLLVNSIPIYRGSPRIAEYFNPEAFINCHDYDNFDQVIERVIEVDNNDDLYRKYVNAPPILEGSEAYAITEEAVMERLDKIMGSIGVITPVCRTMLYRKIHAKIYLEEMLKRAGRFFVSLLRFGLRKVIKKKG